MNREFVYIDFDDERLPPCEREQNRDFPLVVEGSKPKTLFFPRFLRAWAKNRSRIPAKSAQTIVETSVSEPHGILQRIHRIQRKRNMRCGTDPGSPTPGARMTVVTQTPSNNIMKPKSIITRLRIVRFQ